MKGGRKGVILKYYKYPAGQKQLRSHTKIKMPFFPCL